MGDNNKRAKGRVTQKKHGGREEIFDIISNYQQGSLNIVFALLH